MLDALGAAAMAGGGARVLIVSRNANTAADLAAYFGQRGVPVALSDDMVCSEACEPVRAVVVFPDEFPSYLASQGLRKLGQRFSRAWLCVVTRNVVRFERLAEELGNGISERWLVLPRPTWGFRLLERVLAPLPAGEATSERLKRHSCRSDTAEEA
jgi:hypothetical protein